MSEPAPIPSGGLAGTFAHVAGGVRARPVASHLTLMGTLAFSAGVHSGLVAAHLPESPLLASSFLASAVLLMGVAVAVAQFPGSPAPPRAAAALFVALILAYVTFTERLLDPLGITTKLVELTGIAMAVLMRPSAALEADRRTLAPVYLLLAAFVVLVALHASGHPH